MDNRNDKELSCGCCDTCRHKHTPRDDKEIKQLKNRLSRVSGQINTISVRLDNNAKVQEGDVPAEDPKALMEELDRLIVRLEDLVARINLTNSGTVYEGKTITELLAHRDCLKKKVRVLRDFLNTASDRVTRMTRTEIKIVSTVPVTEIQKTVDGLAKELRTVDEKIQELNWTTELV